MTAWIATGSKVASFVALMKVLLHAPGSVGERRRPHQHARMDRRGGRALGRGLDDLRQLRRAGADELQADARVFLDRACRLHARGGRGGRRLADHVEAAGAVLFYLVVYAFSNLGAFALAAWLVRDKGSDEIADLNGLAARCPAWRSASCC